MSALTTGAVTPSACRILADLLPGLKRFLLRKPSEILEQLRDLDNRAYVLQMWYEVFHDRPDTDGYSTFDMEVLFVQRVHQELFPVDLYTMDGYAYCSETETPLSFGVPIDSLGVAWEITQLGDFVGALQVLLAIIGERLVETALGVDWLDTDGFLESAQAWLEKRGIDLAWGLPEGADAYDGLMLLRQALVLQPEPLKGLAVALDTALRNTGNPFLDTVDDGWRCEYDEYDDFYWDTYTIRMLTEHYNSARPRIQQLNAYYKWYDDTPDAESQVVQLLTRLAAGAWSIQDGEIIYHDQEKEC